MKKTPPTTSPSTDRPHAAPRLRRTTLRQLTQVELGKVVAGRKLITTTTGVENDCNTIITR